MGRIRTIKPELREWAPFATLTDAAARLFVMLLTLVDDDGRCPGDATYFAGAVFFGRPRSPNVVGRLLVELEGAELVRRYEVNGAPFVEIVGWSLQRSVTCIEKHQAPRSHHLRRFIPGTVPGCTPNPIP
jgi:hypothetical protein